MRELFSRLQEIVAAGQDVVLVTVIADSGSTPRGSGARMLVGAAGRIYGTIGGGAVEYRSEQLAQQTLQEKKSSVKDFRLAPNEVEDLGMVCGGDVTVYFQYIAAGDAQIQALCAEIAALFQANQDVWLITSLDEADRRMGIYSEPNGLAQIELPVEELKPFLRRRPLRFEQAGRKYYVEPINHAGRVYIFGGGHIAQELAPVLSHLNYKCVVLDDRPEFTNPALFPGAEQVICGDLGDIQALVQITANDYVVVMTRGHAHDYAVQRQVLQLPQLPYYIGVIGSRAKIASVTKRLLADGIPQEKIDRTKSPIGLSIKADTPAEIAISIAGELIQTRAERMGR